MSHDVFVSYSSRDRAVADSVVIALEAAGLRCWVAPRDIVPGTDWAEAIITAITASRYFVLVFSSAANQSAHVKREVNRALEERLRIIPLRVEAIPPSGALAYLLATEHWLDAVVPPLGPHLDHLVRVLQSAPEAQPPPRGRVVVAGNLPELPTQIIARDAEIEEVRALLGASRMVTLVGAGGLGKTRLSIEVAGRERSDYCDGVWFLEMAPLADAHLVAETLAGMLNIPVSGGGSVVDELVARLRRSQTLLVLDNCEHLLVPAASLAEALLRQCPGVKIIATSREALAIPGEQVFRMPTLAVPPAGPITAEAAQHYGAVRLFVERAAAALGRFVLTDSDAEAVAAICRRLDGIALAIELAAPRLRMLTPAKMLARLDEKFRMLTGGSRTALPRQQTLRALFDWSYNLLDEREQILLRRLAIFAGSWTAESATAICAGDPIDEWDVFDLLSSLVDKSLVVATHVGELTRFHFLETTRQYATHRRDEAGESPRHLMVAEHLVGLMEQADREREVTPNAVWIDRWGPELDNIRAAIDWAFEPEGSAQLGVSLISLGRGLWTDSFLTVELRRLRKLAIERINATTPPGIAARLYWSPSARDLSGREEGLKAVEFARASGEPLVLGYALYAYAQAFMTGSEIDKAKQILNEALALARVPGRLKLLARILISFGMSQTVEGNLEEAQNHYQESLRAAQSAGDSQLLHPAYCNVAECLFYAGEVDEAIKTARAAIASANEAGDRIMRCLLTNNLALYLLNEGETTQGFDSAAFSLSEALHLSEEVIAQMAIQNIAFALASTGNFRPAATLQAFVDAACAQSGMALEPSEQVMRDQVHSLIRSVLEPRVLEDLLATGAAMTLEQAAQMALASRPAATIAEAAE